MRIQAATRRLLDRRWVWMGVVAVMLPGSTAAVYGGGGSKTPWPHMFYLPVVAAAVSFGMRGGVLTAITAGVLCGPLMPLDVATGEPQTTGGWLLRLGFFVAVAAVAAMRQNQMAKLVAARQELLSAVSHEVRTPLAAVLGFSELVLENYDELTDEEVREFATLTYQEATELSNVIDHYVLEGRVHHAMIVETAAVDLRQVVGVVLAGIPKEIRETRLEVRGDSVVVEADPLRVRQVVRALINNGLAYGGDRIVVDLRQDARYGMVSVFDAGTVSARRSVGTARGASAAPLGVGLAVARELAELMQGQLAYRLNGRASYELRLPVARHPSRQLRRSVQQ